MKRKENDCNTFGRQFFLSLVSGTLGVLIGIGLPFFTSEQLSKAEARRIRKEEAYINLIEAATAFRTSSVRSQDEFYDEYMKSWIYIDKNVNDAFLVFIDTLNSDNGALKAEKLKLVAIEMRKSLGVKNDIPIDELLILSLEE